MTSLLPESLAAVIDTASPTLIAPRTSSFDVGFVVPIPTKPAAVVVITVPPVPTFKVVVDVKPVTKIP